MEDSKKQVFITVTTIQRDDEKTEIKADYRGTMYVKSGVHYIFYTEYSEENEETAQCRVKCAPGFVEIKRTGAYNSRLSFEEGKIFNSIYSTPYGSMPVTVKTRKVVTAVDANGGKIILNYKMSFGGNDFENEVIIRLRPE